MSSAESSAFMEPSAHSPPCPSVHRGGKGKGSGAHGNRLIVRGASSRPHPPARAGSTVGKHSRLCPGMPGISGEKINSCLEAVFCGRSHHGSSRLCFTGSRSSHSHRLAGRRTSYAAASPKRKRDQFPGRNRFGTVEKTSGAGKDSRISCAEKRFRSTPRSRAASRLERRAPAGSRRSGM